MTNCTAFPSPVSWLTYILQPINPQTDDALIIHLSHTQLPVEPVPEMRLRTALNTKEASDLLPIAEDGQPRTGSAKRPEVVSHLGLARCAWELGIPFS